MALRVRRFALQAVARDILPKTRTALCLRARIKGLRGGGLEVRKARHGPLQRPANLRQRLELPHLCCQDHGTAAAGSSRRDQPASAGGRRSPAPDPDHPHGRGDDLGQLIQRQAKALQAFFRDFTVRAVLAEMGELGRIRAFEVTHGRKGTNNGWHPHYHFLQFCQVKADAAQLMDWRTRLYLRWDACCQRAGLGSPSFAHGIDLQDGRKADRYISKWGLEDELTRGHTKKGRAGGETPFDLLRAVLADKEDRQAAALFLEFSQCFKGKRQLSWSNGLKARFNQAEKDDQEIASEAVEDAQLLGLLTVQQWRDVLKVKARATVLELAAAGGWPSVSRFLWFIDGAAEGVQFDADMLAEARALLMGGMAIS